MMVLAQAGLHATDCHSRPSKDSKRWQKKKKKKKRKPCLQWSEGKGKDGQSNGWKVEQSIRVLCLSYILISLQRLIIFDFSQCYLFCLKVLFTSAQKVMLGADDFRTWQMGKNTY